MRVLVAGDEEATVRAAAQRLRATVDVVGVVVGVERLALQLRLHRPERLVVVSREPAVWRRAAGTTPVVVVGEATAIEGGGPGATSPEGRFRALRLSLGAEGAGEASSEAVPSPGARRRLVAIAASTGGPDALTRILQDLPPSFPAAILIVQHILPGMTAALARQLSSAGPLPVAEARDGERAEAGRVVVAPVGLHLGVARDGAGWTVRLGRLPENAAFCPSADVLFASVAQNAGAEACGVVLTGMGDDGARGLLKMRDAGAYTIVQDEASSTVYGMPRRAAEMGGATVSLPLAAIAGELSRVAG